MKSASLLLISLVMAFLAGSQPSRAAIPSSSVSIIPHPLSLEVGNGVFALNNKTVLAFERDRADLTFTMDYFRSQVRAVTGFPLPVKDITTAPRKNVITFVLVPNDTLGTEGYTLDVRPEGIRVSASTPAGIFYAVQSLFQLMPVQVYGSTIARGVKWEVPAVSIGDRPRYGWRGMMLDVCRHFLPKEFVKRFIDYLAMHKMSRFHWHLTDDQGWRVEIKRYPKLTEVSAWRADREGIHWNVRTEQRPGEKATYGGYYTQDDIREVVRYARERFITVIPEIEMPAHATAVLAAYPELSCTGGPFTVPTGSIWPIKDIYCGGNDATFELLQNILTEVAALFPGEYIHIGGDEAEKTEWKRCGKCQARIKAEGLADEAELQSYFVKRIEKHLKTLNKRLIGWDEILEGGLAPEATVMSWRGNAGGIAAARSGHDAVMSPTSNCYFDYYQGVPSLEPLAIGGFLPLRTVYDYNPTPDSLAGKETQHILGVQGNLWTEYIPTPAQAEYMVFPRIAALAEVGWTDPGRKNWEGFLTRLYPQFERYTQKKINFARSIFAVTVTDSFDVPTRSHIVTLGAEAGAAGIRHTLAGKNPTPASPGGPGPFVISRPTEVRAASFHNDRISGPVTAQTLSVNPRGILGVTFSSPPDRANGDPLSLVDNLRAVPRSSDERWIGIRGSDLEAVIDLGTTTKLRKISAGFLHESTGLVFLPPEVVFSLSDDGVRFTPVATLTQESPLRAERPFVRDYIATSLRASGRYLKITARNAGTVPDWHRNAGQPTWVMVDEVAVE